MPAVMEIMVERSLGQRISEERARRGMLQRDLAAKLDKASSWVSNLENGKLASPPDAETMRRIEEVLGIPEEDVLRAFGYLKDADGTGTDAPDDSARIYTMIERNQHLTPFQRQLIRMAWEESERRRKELEG